MRFPSSVIGLVLLLASPALGVASQQERDSQQDFECAPFLGYEGYGYGPTDYVGPGIAFPKANQTITPGVPFLFQYCSGQYFKTYTIEISVGFDDGTGKGVVNLLRYNVNPSAQYTYKFNLTTTRAQAGKGKLVVSEIASGYYEPYQYLTSSVQTNIKPAKFLGIL